MLSQTSTGADIPLAFSGSPTAAASLTFDASSETPERSWVTSGSYNVEQTLSPQGIRANSFSSARDGQRPTSLQRWNSLVGNITHRNVNFAAILNRCLDLFFEYLYPLTPLVHEPSLRDMLAYFLPSAPNLDPQLESGPDAAFTLITAVCAEAAFLLPKDIFPEGESVADIFLQASRTCLHDYLEADLEHPNASSVTIRYFHSNCLHAAGKPKFSWHIFGEATRLAQVMRLHDETSYEGLYPIEAEMRRRVFWIVYMGDKSAAILNSRPITMHKYSFESGITAAYPSGTEEESHQVVSPSSNATAGTHDGAAQNIITGFNANIRLWQAASDLILALRLIQDQANALERDIGQAGPIKTHLTPEEREAIDPLYVRFITCLDDLPPFLQSYAFASIAGKVTTQSKQFLTQCANLQVSLHCLRMVITQKFEDLSYFAPGAEQADLRKTEIVRDMLRVIHEVPFWALQVNGEPYVSINKSKLSAQRLINGAILQVEKIRLIGASLLAIIHRNPTSPIATRARGDFSILLDILTRLDSKASDALRNNSSWIL